MLLTGFVLLSANVSTPATAFAFHSAIEDQGPSPILAPGTTTSYSVRFRNTGLLPWQRGGSAQVNLAVAGDATEFTRAGIGVNWISENRIATTGEQIVLPGMLGSFTFTVRAPTTPGTYRVPLRLVVDGLTWLEDDHVALVLTSDLGFHGQLLDQSLHPTLAPGDTSVPLTVRFRNTGARTWTRGAVGQVNLGIVGDDKSMLALAAGWPTPDRVAIQAEPSVGPGAIATYTFRVKAPMTAGIYPLRLRLVADGLTWLDGEDVITLVTVGATAGAPADKAIVIGTPTFTFVAGASPSAMTIGQAVKVTTTVKSIVASSAVIGVDVYSPGGSTVAFEKWFHNENFGAGEERTYPISWTIPAGATLGTYRVDVSAYAVGWKSLFGAKAAAASFSVAAAAVPPTPAPTSAPTTAPTSVPPTGATMTPTGAPTTAVPTATPAASPTAAPTPAPSFSAASSVTPASVAAGGSVAVTALVTSSGADSALVDVEIWAPGALAPTYQVWFDNQTFAAGQQRSYPASWQVPTGATLGSYTVKVGVFAPAWTTNYTWANPAGFTVSAATPSPTPSPTPTPGVTPTSTPTATPTPAPTATPVPSATPTAAPSFSSSATVSPTSVVAGSSVTITATFLSATAVTGVVPDMYVYSPDGATLLGEQFFTNQTFAAGQQRVFTMSWTAPPTAIAGTYIVRLGVASATDADTSPGADAGWRGLTAPRAGQPPRQRRGPGSHPSRHKPLGHGVGLRAERRMGLLGRPA